MGKVILLLSFFTIAPFVIIIAVLLLSYQTDQHAQLAVPESALAYTVIPPSYNYFTQELGQKDTRTELIRQFFAKHKSPLEPYADHVVLAADTYGLDYRLVPAIAMQESNLCKKIPKNSHNCWGFGIYGSRIKRFTNYPEAINTVTKTLARDYKSKGLTTPYEIMSRYTPTSNGSWARGVIEFMNQL